jgi:hypothetical protein
MAICSTKIVPQTIAPHNYGVKMNNAKLKRWADLLLDTSKRNNLINFKDTNLNSAKVLSPGARELFKKVNHREVTFEIIASNRADFISAQDNNPNKIPTENECLDHYSKRLKGRGQANLPSAAFAGAHKDHARFSGCARVHHHHRR